MKSYKSLVNAAIKAGYLVSVFDGEEFAVKRSANRKDIFAAIESVEEAQLRIRSSDGEYIGWALVTAYGVADEETVVDYSDNEIMRALCGDAVSA